MGGKVDAHGVGITSGLEKRTGMNQGGRVGSKAFGIGSGYQQKNHGSSKDKVTEKVTVGALRSL